MGYVDGGNLPETGPVCGEASRPHHQDRPSGTTFESILYQNGESHDGKAPRVYRHIFAT